MTQQCICQHIYRVTACALALPTMIANVLQHCEVAVFLSSQVNHVRRLLGVNIFCLIVYSSEGAERPVYALYFLNKQNVK
jgi:hypothetical protein